jgi:cytoskeletal protein CcmA (bactofilin family)
MWWEKKTTEPVAEPDRVRFVEAPPASAPAKTPMSEPTSKSTHTSAAPGLHTLLGRTVVMQGQLSSGEDLQIEGQFEGNINLDDHCLTIGTEGRVKAEIHARQVVIMGSLIGNVAAREKVDIRRTGHVVGDLVAATVAIEEGAYFKGSIDVTREGEGEAALDAAPHGARSGA